MIILYIILAIIAIPLIAAALLSKNYLIERSVTIDRSRQDIFNFIKLLRNADQYNKWVMIDPKLIKTFSGTDGTKGCVYAWESENKQVGKGEQEITSITEGDKIEYELRFFKPFENVCGAYLSTKTVSDNQTHVTWGFMGERNYPMRIFHFLFNLKKVLGNDLQTSLHNLKNVLEK